jgi:hypothetical protein
MSRKSDILSWVMFRLILITNNNYFVNTSSRLLLDGIPGPTISIGEGFIKIAPFWPLLFDIDVDPI